MTEADNQNTTDEQPQSTPGVGNLIEHAKKNKIETAMWASRVLTIVFAVSYLIPIFSNSQSAFYKVLMANAATSALRLHQRLPRVSFTKAFFTELLLEDSCHYLLYSLIFLHASPMIFILVPVILFAVLHAASYSLTLLDAIGQNSWWGARLLISLVEFQARNILRFAAFAEIMLMPLCVLFAFIGRAGFMTPFIYYHFITLRYGSRRNPYTRNMFFELRLSVMSVANNPSVPALLRKVLLKAVEFVSRLAPQMQPAPAQ